MSTYAEEIRVPFIFYLPGIAGHRFRNLVGTIDLLPTVLDITGLDPPRKHPIRGISLLPAMVNAKEPPDRAYLSEQTRYTQEFSLVTRKYQLRYDMSHNIFELYDRQKDPGEFHDLSQQLPEVVLKLRRELMLKLFPIMEVTAGRISKVLLERIPPGFRKVSGEFEDGPEVAAIQVKRLDSHRYRTAVVFKAFGPMTKGKYFHVKLMLALEDGTVLGSKKEAAAHYYYVPSMWRKGDLVLHSTVIRTKKPLKGKTWLCVQFLIDGKALHDSGGNDRICYVINK